MIKIKKFAYIIIIIALLSGTFVGGAFFGYYNRPEIEKVTEIFNKEISKPPEVNFEPFWKAWNIVDEKFTAENGIDNQKRVWGAIQGMVKSLGDPYSVFFPPEESKMFKEDIRGDFGGVGMEIGIRKGVLTVIAPLKGTPAERAGLKSGDQILKINDTLTADMTSEEAARLIRGPEETVVRLTIFREDKEEPFEIEITRAIIQIPVLDTETKPGGIFVIKLYNFSANSPQNFKNALRDFILSGNNKLILDLRNNSGGYLEAAVDMASWFLSTGKIVTVERFADGNENFIRSKGYDIFENLPMVILVNNGTASASEILAGALQEHKIAILVGEKTFGKGSVQEMFEITKDTSLKLTIAQWLTPNRKSISKEGLEPDIKIEMTEKDIEADRDPQMEKAVEIISSQ